MSIAAYLRNSNSRSFKQEWGKISFEDLSTFRETRKEYSHSSLQGALPRVPIVGGAFLYTQTN